VRIALYHNNLPQAEQKPGGVAVFVDRLAGALAQRGHDVTAFTYQPPSEPRPYAVRRLWPGARGDRRVLRHYALPWLFNVRPFDGSFDVLHLHGDDWFYMRRRLPTVRTFYGSALMESLTATSRKRRINQAAIFRLERMAARRADAVYGIGPDSRMLYEADGILSCGVPLPEEPGDPAPEPTILFIGTWEGRKRGELLHRAFQEHVRPVFPDARLWMVSDRAPDGDGVTAFARPSDEELQQLLRRAWLFCLPSAYEGLGIPYLEAMAHGVPVVATPNPGAEHVLAGGRFGELVEPRELGPALVRLLGDGERRAQLGAAGRERVRDFAWERLLEDYEAAYALAIERWRAAHGAAA
jgi:glycosyltransferase involved in cell wall biosynthesis